MKDREPTLHHPARQTRETEPCLLGRWATRLTAANGRTLKAMPGGSGANPGLAAAGGRTGGQGLA
jgi:hypothetical protein